VSGLILGALAAVVLVALLLSGLPVAFALGAVSLLFLLLFEGPGQMQGVADALFGSLNAFALLAIPMFVLMGTVTAASRAGADLQEALVRWLHRVPGGLVISNVAACGIFAALTGSSRATCAAIGETGIPGMRERGYPARLATGSIAAGGTLGILIPPSITLIVYGIATETSIGRLFMAGLLPGIMLMALFMGWVWLTVRSKDYRLSAMPRERSLGDTLIAAVRVIPFLALTALLLWAIYTGVATPAEAAALGSVFAIALVTLIYGVLRPRELWGILRTATRESVMLMMIIATAALFGFTMSTLGVPQGIAEWIASLDLSTWWLLFYVNVFLLAAGLMLPPVAIIPMSAPVLVPLMDSTGFDPLWFGIMLVINLQIGLITPPLGLNLRVIDDTVGDVERSTVLRGTLPFGVCLLVALVLLAIFPGIATWLPNALTDTLT
jgi:tripartite ATP-independent transporter DctM subunit